MVIVGISQAASMSSQRADRLSRADFDELVDRYQAPLLRFLYGLIHDPESRLPTCARTRSCRRSGQPRGSKVSST